MREWLGVLQYIEETGNSMQDNGLGTEAISTSGWLHLNCIGLIYVKSCPIAMTGLRANLACVLEKF